MDNNELWARMSAQQAELQSRWDDYFRMQQEQQNTLVAKQEVARTVETAWNEVSKGANDAMFVMGEWEKVVNKTALVHHANELGLDTHMRAENGIDPNLVSGNQHEDWSWLHMDNPFSKDPSDLAGDAQDLAGGAADLGKSTGGV